MHLRLLATRYGPPVSRRESGFTIAEAAVAAAIVGIFFGAMFTLNSSCLNLVRNSKESAAAMLSDQQRVEQLRSCNWSQITDSIYWAAPGANPSYYLTSIMNTPTQSGSALQNATEIIRVTENGFVQGGSAAFFEIMRTPNGATITASNDPKKLFTARMLKVDVTLNWNATGGRRRNRLATAIIAQGGLTINETTTIAPDVRW